MKIVTMLLIFVFLSTTTVTTAIFSNRNCDYYVGELNMGCYIPKDFKEKARDYCDEKGYKLESIYWKPKAESSQVNCEVRDDQLYSQLINNKGGEKQ